MQILDLTGNFTVKHSSLFWCSVSRRFLDQNKLECLALSIFWHYVIVPNITIPNATIPNFFRDYFRDNFSVFSGFLTNLAKLGEGERD